MPGFKKELVVLAGVPFAFGVGAIILGQDSNWDLHNYHVYNPYAFLSNRLSHDFAPAQLQTYYNPLLHIPYFWMVAYLPPRVTGFLLGTLQGANFCLLFEIARRATGRSACDYKFVIAFVLALVGMLGAGNVSELGTAMGDNIVSLFVLGALLILILRHAEMISQPSRVALPTAAIAGCIAGLGGGLKLTSLIFSLGFGIGIVALTANLSRSLLLALSFFTGVLLGVLTTSGFWFYDLWVRVGNPLFPYFNHVFQSPFAGSHSYRDFRFLPSGIVEASVYPLMFLFNSSKVAEVAFRDLRIPLLYLGSIFLILKVILTRPIESASAKGVSSSSKGQGIERLLLLGICIAYIAWLKLFGIYRYLVVLEMLAPIVLWIVITRLAVSMRIRLVSLSTLCLLLLATTQPLNWGRRDWSERYFEVSVPKLPSPEKTLVVIAGRAPLSYLVPHFPQAARFIRLESNFHSPSLGPQFLNERLKAIISRHQGPLYILFDTAEDQQARLTGAYYGLTIANEDCSILENGKNSNSSWIINFCEIGRPIHLAGASSP